MSGRVVVSCLGAALVLGGVAAISGGAGDTASCEHLRTSVDDGVDLGEAYGAVAADLVRRGGVEPGTPAMGEWVELQTRHLEHSVPAFERVAASPACYTEQERGQARDALAAMARTREGLDRRVADTGVPVMVPSAQ